MAECTICGKETEWEYTWVKARYLETVSAEREEKIPILGRNYRADESPEVRKVGEVRYYFEKVGELAGGLCEECMARKRKDDGWFRLPYFILLAAAAGGLIFGGEHPLVHLLSLFLLFMTLVGIAMRVARSVSHNDQIRVAEAMEGYFLDEDKGGDGITITKREFLYRPVKSPERFVLFSPAEWEEMKSDGKGVYLA